ncbi:MAG: hypothetical protein P9L94_01185 [Candidatus Hinthialibacter antarcticus]|nr:hypothetical protein [Candidatus Hinthialibacter antarcticus]
MIDLDIVAFLFQMGGAALVLAFPVIIIVLLVLIYRTMLRIERKQNSREP